MLRKDLDELRRMATNMFDGDKETMRRIISSITNMYSENQRLKLENAAMREKFQDGEKA